MTVRVFARHRGPLVLECLGDEPLEIFRTDGSRVELGAARKVRLCRCGASRAVPLCDGAHHRVDFATPDPGQEDGGDSM